MKKKFFLAVLLCLALTFSLTACGADESDTSSESSQTESVSESETSDESESVSESEVEEETEETSEASEEIETSEVSETSSSASGSADISDAIDGSTTSDESAVPLGQWAAVTNYATADSAYHTVYVRVTKVTAYSEDEAYIQEAIDLNNANSYDWGQIDLADYTLPDDVEWCLLDYEVYVPEDFPSALDNGSINEPSMSLSATNIGGGGIPSNDNASTYIGMGSNKEDLEVYSSDEAFMPGNTYAFKMLYAMVIGYQDYVFDMTAYYDGTTSDETSTDTMYHVYFANK